MTETDRMAIAAFYLSLTLSIFMAAFIWIDVIQEGQREESCAHSHPIIRGEG